MTPTTSAYYDYTGNDHNDYGDDFGARPKRRNKPGKNKRAARQARFRKETGFLTRSSAEAAEERFNLMLTN